MNGRMRRMLPGNWAAICVATLALAQPWAVDAATLGFLMSSALGHFKAEDVNLMKKNAAEVLESTSAHASQSWSNPKTGNSGAAEVLDAFSAADGTPCKRLRISNKVKRGNIEDQATYTICKYPDRGWQLNGQVQ